MNPSRIAIIIPACNEEACIGPVLEELLTVIDREKFIVAVGVNHSSDRTAEIAQQYPVVVAETARRGYGHGCQAAINAVVETFPEVEAYCFMAADGASDPADLAAWSRRTSRATPWCWERAQAGARTGAR